MSSTLRLWNQWNLTDPEHTKPVKFGRKFTSIDAHWQIMKVTEMLGPVGEGWGYTVDHSTFKVSDLTTVCFADVSVWWTDDESKNETNTFGPIRGCCELYYQQTSYGKPQFEDDGRPKMMLDDDAPKKATTDALTKALSHLGVSADVFLGRFDDNKYVEKMKRHFAQAKAIDSLPVGVSIALDELPKAKTLEELTACADRAREAAKTWDRIHLDLYATRLKERRLQLGGTVPLPAE